jgi:hypothetical protein
MPCDLDKNIMKSYAVQSFYLIIQSAKNIRDHVHEFDLKGVTPHMPTGDT